MKSILCAVIRLSGVPFVIRKVVSREKATILYYHDPTPETFDKHLDYLSKRYTIISLDQLIQAIHDKNPKALPPQSLVITIDDGHAGNFNLREIAQKYTVRPTVYLCSQIINTRRKYWFKVVQGSAEPYKRLAQAERLAQLEDAYQYTPVREYDGRDALNQNELETMCPDFDFGGHTRFHPILPRCSPEEARTEIVHCKRDLEALLHTECAHFAFPNGAYTEREIHYVRQAGYRSARTTEPGWNTIHTDAYRLRAMFVTDDASISLLSIQASGIGVFLRRWFSKH